MKNPFSLKRKPEAVSKEDLKTKSDPILEAKNTLNRYSVYLFGVIAILVVMWYLFLWISRTFSPDVLYSYLAADPTQPTIPGMFLANYLHKDWCHLLGNILYTVLAFAFIVLVYILRSIKYILLSPTYFRWLFLLFLFPLPFLISGVSIVSSTISGGSVGFSGIAYAFIGAFFGLLVYPIYFLYTEKDKSSLLRKTFGVGICALYTIILIWTLLTINPIWVDSGVNYVAHVTGAIFGYMFTVFFDFHSSKASGISHQI